MTEASVPPTKTKPSTRRQVLRRIALMLTSTALTLVGLEILFRLCGLEGSYHSPRVDQVVADHPESIERVPFGFAPHVTVQSIYGSDPRDYFEPGNLIGHQFNSVGWRDVEHPVKKPENTFRILGLGDSYLYGQGVRFEDICFTKLSGELSSVVAPRRLELINAAVNASNTEFQRDLLQKRGLMYEPDLVIVHFVLNDVESMRDLFVPGAKIEFGVEYTAIYEQKDSLSDVSSLWSWSRQKWLRSVRAHAYLTECLESFSENSLKWRRCQAALDDIQRQCQESHAGLLVVVFPFFHDLDGDYPFQPIHDAVTAHCRKRSIPLLDLRDAYRNFNGPELWVHPTDQHPNEKAHAIAAEEIGGWLRQHPELLRAH